MYCPSDQFQMATFGSVSPSAAPSISDLDGFTLSRDGYFSTQNTYAPPDNDDFGFDPPHQKSIFSRNDQMYSPPDMAGWPGFERDDQPKAIKQDLPHPYEIDRLIAQNLPNATNSLSRYGQITPPRTSSTSSETDPKVEEAPRASARKRTKTQLTDSADPTPKAPSGRKRKASKKSVATAGQTDHLEDNKRKASLEKNRLAAAKCRINKKEKTEQLQRDSHDKGLHNAFLREQIMRMKTELQHMHAILLAHANCDGCKSPDEIQKHLATIGQEYMNNQMMAGGFDNYSQMQMDENPGGQMVDDYFSSMSPENPAMLHPPLPEFNRSAEFEVHTPMQTN